MKFKPPRMVPKTFMLTLILAPSQVYSMSLSLRITQDNPYMGCALSHQWWDPSAQSLNIHLFCGASPDLIGKKYGPLQLHTNAGPYT